MSRPAGQRRRTASIASLALDDEGVGFDGFTLETGVGDSFHFVGDAHADLRLPAGAEDYFVGRENADGAGGVASDTSDQTVVAGLDELAAGREDGGGVDVEEIRGGPVHDGRSDGHYGAGAVSDGSDGGKGRRHFDSGRRDVKAREAGRQAREVEPDVEALARQEEHLALAVRERNESGDLFPCGLGAGGQVAPVL